MQNDDTTPPATAQVGLVVHWTHFKSVNSKTPMEAAPVAWQQAATWLTDPQYRMLFPQKESAPLISFAEFDGQRRKLKIKNVTAIVLDFDDGTPFETIRLALASIEFAAYSTHSHAPEKPRFRVIIPLSRPVTVAEYQVVWMAINAKSGGTADHGAKDASRISYWPSCPQENFVNAFTHHNRGEILDPNALLASPASPPAGAKKAAGKHTSLANGISAGPPDMKQGVKKGTRHKELLRRVGSCLGPGKMTEEEALSACLEWGKLCDPVLEEDEIRRAVADIAEDERKKPVPQLPYGYSIKEDGLYWQQMDKEKPSYPLRVSGPFEVVAKTRDANSEAWGVLLRWRDPDNTLHDWAMPRSMLAGDATEVRERLMHGGLHIEPGRTARERFAAYLSTVCPADSVRCVDCTGWHGNVFVTPGKTYGDTTGERTWLQSAAPVSDFKNAGSLEGWKEQVAAPAVGNSRLAFAMSAAFAGPLLKIVNAESGGFHITGASSIGKTTALHSAVSVWGCGVDTWRTTDNAAENTARNANDSLLTLDEIGQADARAADMLAYMFSNGQGKQRSKRDGTARKVAQWRVMMLSTGEIGLAEKIAEVGKRARAGQAVRLIEIPADAGAGHGMFENLHGSPNGAAFANRIKKAAAEHTGHAAPLFIEQIVKDPEAARKKVDAIQRAWIEKHLPRDADGQVSRAAGRFALVAAAGERAIEYGILPWPKGEADNAAAVCFKAWITRRGGIGSAEITEGIAQVMAFLEAHGAARFEIIGDRPQSLMPHELRIFNRAGYREKNKEGFWEHHILPEIWRNEVCKGHDASTIAKALVERGMMITDSGGRCTKIIRVPGLGPTRVYSIAPSFLACTE